MSTSAMDQEDQDKVLELAAIGLASIGEIEELRARYELKAPRSEASLAREELHIAKLFPKALRSSVAFAKKLCVLSPKMVDHFDQSVLSNKELVVHVLKEIAAGRSEKSQKANRSLDVFLKALPTTLINDRAFIFEAIRWHPSAVYNWSAHAYHNDSQYEELFLKHFRSKSSLEFKITTPMPRELAIAFCKLSPSNYGKVCHLFKDDVELACITVGASRDDFFDIEYLDKSIRSHGAKLARVIASSALKHDVFGIMEEKDHDTLWKELRKINPDGKAIGSEDTIYDVAKFICKHEDAKLERKALGKAATIKRKSAPKDAFKKSL